MWPFDRKTRHCDVHDVPSQHRIRQLEQELGLEQSPPEGDLVDQLYDPALVDCGYRWCSERRRTNRYPEVGGHASADITIHELPPPPEWMMRRR